MTDVSLFGWGGVLGLRWALDYWTPPEKARLPINVLGLQAIRLSLEHWRDQLWGLPVRSQLENATAVAYVNYQGSAAAVLEVSHILRLAY